MKPAVLVETPADELFDPHWSVVETLVIIVVRGVFNFIERARADKAYELPLIGLSKLNCWVIARKTELIKS